MGGRCERGLCETHILHSTAVAHGNGSFVNPGTHTLPLPKSSLLRLSATRCFASQCLHLATTMPSVKATRSTCRRQGEKGHE